MGCTSSLLDLTPSTPSLLLHSEAVDLSFGTRMRLQLEEATSALELLQRLATEYDKHKPQHITACGAALFCCFCVVSQRTVIVWCTSPMEVLTAKDSTDATFGFNKTSVLMTECGKVFGLRVCNATAACSVVYPTHDPRRLVVWLMCTCGFAGSNWRLGVVKHLPCGLPALPNSPPCHREPPP